MSSSSLTDADVARLLERDAKEASKRFATQGLSAYLPNRATTHAPSVNKRFLGTLLRETGSHNKALLAKEADEARVRLRNLKEEQRRINVQARGRGSRRYGLEEGRPSTKRRRIDNDVISTDRNRLSPPSDPQVPIKHGDKSRSRDGNKELRHESSDREGFRESERRRDGMRREVVRSEDRRRSHYREGHRTRRSRSRSISQSDRCSDDDRRSRARRRYRSGERGSKKRRRRSRSHSSSSRNEGQRRRPRHSQSRSRSPGRQRAEAGSKRSSKRRHSPSSPRLDHGQRKTKRRRSPEPRGRRLSSDPLEELVGPLPPAPPARVVVRGRGAATASNIDERFSSGYDPSRDVALDPAEDDEWGEALEALQARASFARIQGDRLRAAGFSEEEVRLWEKGGEKDENDVKWAKKGEGREWDRGKVFSDDGRISVPGDLEYGRLKGT